MSEEWTLTLEGREATPERRLWVAVLVRALLDAGGKGGPIECKRAQVWLREDRHAEDRRLVYLLSDVDQRKLDRWLGQLEPFYQLFPDHDYTRQPSAGRRPATERASRLGRIAALPRQGKRRNTEEQA